MELDIKHNQCASTKRTLKTKNTYAYGKFVQNSCETNSYISVIVINISLLENQNESFFLNIAVSKMVVE